MVGVKWSVGIGQASPFLATTLIRVLQERRIALILQAGSILAAKVSGRFRRPQTPVPAMMNRHFGKTQSSGSLDWASLLASLSYVGQSLNLH